MKPSARSLILLAAGNPATRAFMSRYGMRLGATRFVAGETLDACVSVIRDLNRRGMKANATVLGEAVRDREEAAQAVLDYEELIERLAREDLRANAAVKLSLLGMDVGRDVARSNLERVRMLPPRDRCSSASTWSRVATLTRR